MKLILCPLAEREAKKIMTDAEKKGVNTYSFEPDATPQDKAAAARKVGRA